MLSRVSPAPASVSEFYFFGLIVPLRTFCAQCGSSRAQYDWFRTQYDSFRARCDSTYAKSDRLRAQYDPSRAKCDSLRARWSRSWSIRKIRPKLRNFYDETKFLKNLVINGYRINHILFIKFLKISSIDICWMQL